MRSAVSSSSVRDLWGDRRGLCFSCDLRYISCWHFELIFADLLLKQIFPDSGSQPFPPFWGFHAGQVSIFHWIPSVWQCQLADACRGGSCSQGCHGYLLAMPEVFRLLSNLKGPSPQAHLLAMSLNYGSYALEQDSNITCTWPFIIGFLSPGQTTAGLSWGQLVSCAAVSVMADPASFCFRLPVRMSYKKLQEIYVPVVPSKSWEIST